MRKVFSLEAIGLEIGHGITERFTIDDEAAGNATTEVIHSTVSRRDGWQVRVETRTRLTSTEDAFRLAATLEAYEGDERVFERSWDRVVARDSV